ncbi:S8 family serine peptidase [Clostridium sp.]|uniref:S8 family serine peptidase n=1 Tax=Clostridium sp. TaxID=1506 RepID=UPI0034647DEB
MGKNVKKLISIAIALSIITGSSTGVVAHAENAPKSKEAVKEEMIKNFKASDEKNKEKINKSIEKDPEKVVRGIVELEDNGDEEKVKEALEKLEGYSFRRSFGTLVKGMSFEIKRGEIEKIKDIEGVKSVKESDLYQKTMSSAKAITKAVEGWKEYGYKGEGMVISIIDSGIDTSHKDLKLTDPSKAKIKEVKESQGTKYNMKVPYGKNFADNNEFTIDEAAAGEHGMHVGGIVAGNGEDFKGVAPEAQLLSMKVLGDKIKMASEDDIIAAIEDSVEQGADVINMSLTTAANFDDSDSMFQKAVQAATEKGVVVVVAAGNDGVYSDTNPSDYPVNNQLGLTDTSILGNPANTLGAITVASYENSERPYNTLEIKGDGFKETVTYEAIDPFGSGIPSFKDDEHKVVTVDINNLEEEIKNLGGENGLNDSFAFIKYDKSIEKFNEKLSQISNILNPKGLVIYGDLDFKNAIYYYSGGLQPSILLTKEDGEKLNSVVNKNGTIKFKEEKKFKDNAQKGSMSSFTSWGPTTELEFKPDVTAPGGNIYSTMNKDKYAAMSGTSMAAPHVAGAVALVLQGLKENNIEVKDKVTFAKNTLLNTADTLEDIDVSKGLPYSPRRQGSGIIQIDKAIGNKVIATGDKGVANIALKEIGNNTEFTFKIKNYSNEELSFSLNKTPVLSEKIVDNEGRFGAVTIPDSVLTLDKNEVTLKGGEEIEVKGKLDLPATLTKGRFIEGYINIDSKDNKNPSLTIPYMGFFGDFDAEPIFDKPKYEEESKVKTTGLMTEDGMIFDKEGYISPNEDGIQDSLLPSVFAFRHCKDLLVDVVDKNNGEENVIRSLSNIKNFRRLPLTELTSYLPLIESLWDGTVFHEESGEYRTIEEGSYFIRVKGRVKEDTEYQTLYLPFNVDVNAPKVNIMDTKIKSDKDQNVAEIIFKAEDLGDKASGMEFNEGTLQGYIGGQPGTLVGEVENLEENVYKATFATEGKDIRNVYLGIRDKAGNVTVEVSQVYIEGIYDGAVINSNYLNENGKVELRGVARRGITSVEINGNKVNTDNRGNFNVEIDLKQGIETLKIKGYEGEEAAYEDIITPIVDTIVPEFESLKFEEIREKEDGSKDFKVWGRVKNTEYTYSSIALRIMSEIAPINNQGYFDIEVNIPKGMPFINVGIDDVKDNMRYLQIPLEVKESSITFNNLENAMLFLFKSSGVKEDGTFNLDGKVSEDVKVLKINGEKVTLNEDKTFNTPMKLKDGLNKFRVTMVMEDKKEEELYGVIINDEKAPVVTSNLDKLADKDNIIRVSGDEFTIEGSIVDNTFGYKLRINGDEVVNTISRLGIMVSMEDKVFEKKDFTYKVKLDNEETSLEVLTEDCFKNQIIKTYKIVKEKK